MKNKVQISATIVLFKEDIKVLKKTIDSFLNTNISKKLFLIDNSPDNNLKSNFLNLSDVEYHFVGKNIGFGAGHNMVLEKIRDISNYHLILNPDVEFKAHVITELIQAIEKHKDVAMIAPKVVFQNGKHQHTCRKYPTLLEMVSRRLKIFNNYTQKHEYRNIDLSKSFNPEFIHGCFYMFKTEDFIKIGGFDERYFLYMEDVDICRKIDQLGKKKLYYPEVEITHILKKESSKKLKLFFTHLNSSIKYFKKWSV